jgi:hypothetical protein
VILAARSTCAFSGRRQAGKPDLRGVNRGRSLKPSWKPIAGTLKKSTGPRTEEGKKNSSLNATKHGLRAETLVLRGEDLQVLEDRREAWRACLLPGDDVEERLVDDAVVSTWQQDRARRAQAGRLSANILEGAKGRWFWEIEMETTDDDLRRFRLNAADRQLESLKPKDAAEARQAMLGIVERATERLTAKAEAHRERARVMASLAPDFLAFDASPDGERLRRFDLASGRALARSLAELRKHRREARNVSGPLMSVVSGPLSVVGGTLEARDESGRLAAMHSPSLGASPYQPDAQARDSTDQMTRDAHYQPDAQVLMLRCF